jgi:ubiquinone/menaquinone biosynthesis C-methylase UbiE
MGFADIEAFLKEAHRVLKVGGVMWVYDMEGVSPIVRKVLHYKTLPKEAFTDLAESAGFDVYTLRPDRVYKESFMKLLDAEPEESRSLIKIGLTTMRPVLYKLTRKP